MSSSVSIGRLGSPLEARARVACPEINLWKRAAPFPVVASRYKLHRLADAIAIAVVWRSVPFRPWLTAAALTRAIVISPWFYRHRTDVSVLDELPGVLVASALVVSRMIVAPLLRRCRRRSPAFRNRTLVVGTGNTTLVLARTLATRSEFGLTPVALVNGELCLAGEMAFMELEIPHETPTNGLAALIKRHHARTIINGIGTYDDQQLLRRLWECDHEEPEVFIVPGFFDHVDLDGTMDRVNAINLTRVKRPAYRSLAWRLKRPTVLMPGAVVNGAGQ